MKEQTLISLARKAVNNPRKAALVLLRSALGMAPRDAEADRIAGWKHGQLPRVAAAEAMPELRRVGVSLLNTFDQTAGTSLDIAELVTLCGIARCVVRTSVLEIGTFDGNTTLNLAANTPDTAVISTIDLPPEWSGKLVLDVPRSRINVTDRGAIGRQYRGTRHASKINQVFGDSAEFDFDTLPTPFDLVFIDGCHSFDYAKLDTENARTCLRPGGVIVWHDYGMIADVSRAVDEAARTLSKAFAVRGTRLAVGFS